MATTPSNRRPGARRGGQVAILLCGLLCGAAPAAAAQTPPQTPEQALEANLLHRRVSLGGLKAYSRERSAWLPLRPPSARVLVVNLWSRICMPCLAELPELTKLVAAWRKDKNVQFLFIADPPEQTSAAQTASFWTSPLVDELAGRCPGTRMPRGDHPSCLLTVPDLDPARAEDDSLPREVGSEARPLTLILDDQGTIRQVFAGALAGRSTQLDGAIRRLLPVVRSRAAPAARRSGS